MRPLSCLCAVALIPVASGAWAAPPVSSDASDSSARPLALQEAINDALANNVQPLLAQARQNEAAGNRRTARAVFLPHLSVRISQSRQQTNLAAQGFDFGSDVSISGGGANAGAAAFNFPTVVTYNHFDARARLRQTLFDYSAWQKYQGAKLGEKVSRARLAVAREQVAMQAALDYVSALAAVRSVVAAQADLKQANRLLELARDQMHVGVATGLDLTRAKSRRARDRAKLAEAETKRTRAEIQLARTTGWPLGSDFKLTDPLVFRPMPLPPATAEVNRALASRPEITLAQARIRRRQTDVAAAEGQRLPTVSLQASYGDSANTYLTNDRGTYSVGAEFNMPLFNGGAISGQVDSAKSRLNQQRIRYRDTRKQIAQDVLTSRQTMETLADRVRAARSNLTLAKQELERARNRFSSGVIDNVEVVDAQASLAEARMTRISALAEYTRARINLASALGRAQQFSLTQPMSP